MIPRFKPCLGKAELLAALRPQPDAVPRFEAAFARAFEAKHAIAFSYGRSALWAFFKAMGIEGAEVIMPAYTCVVVAHATVLSGNIPRFVDITLHDYNMDLDQVEKAINNRTRVILATHLFGYPLDVDRLREIVRRAESRFGHKIWVIQDCAHAFGARWQGKLVCNAGDAALFGLNISKTMTSVFGGMLTTSVADVDRHVREFREQTFTAPRAARGLARLFYLLGVYMAFERHAYGLVHWMETGTPLLNRLTRAYHLDGSIHFPPDYRSRMQPLEARVGIVQLRRHDDMVRRRQQTAAFYSARLASVKGWVLPPLVDGATYSHYVVRVPDRATAVRRFCAAGIQLGELIQYCVPRLDSYRRNCDEQFCRNAVVCSQSTVNLPIHHGLGRDHLKRIVSVARGAS